MKYISKLIATYNRFICEVMASQQTHLYHRLQLAAHRAQKAADRAVSEAAGVTTAQAAVLSVIAASGPSSQRAIAECLGLNESAIAQMTGRLLKLGLVARNRDETDGRVWRLDLTDQGRTALALLRHPFQQINAAMDATLDEAEIERLADALDRVAKVFGKA